MLNLIEKDLDLEVLKSLYQNREDLQLAWTKAAYPFDEGQWRQWFKESSEKRAFSLYLEHNGEVIGHTAVLDYKTGAKVTYLCFLVIDRKYRGQGFGKSMVHLSCEFIRDKLRKSVAYLMVDPENKSALECYLSCGFSYVDGDNPRRYKKML